MDMEDLTTAYQRYMQHSDGDDGEHTLKISVFD